MKPSDGPGRPLLQRRIFTPVFLVRRWQVEKNRDEHAGECEEALVTPERLREVRGLVRQCFPEGKVTWSLSRGAILTPGAHWDAVRDVLAQFAAEDGDALVPNPCSGYTILYNDRAAVEAEIRELMDGLQAFAPAAPRALHAWVVPAQTIAATHAEFGLDAVSGHCWSQFGIDNMSMDGSVAYPYYPSADHVLVPAPDRSQQVDVPLLDVITLDFVTARFTRKKARRQCRMGLQLLETVNYHRIGPEAGLRELKAVAATLLTDNVATLPFAWITTTQEVVEMFREEASFPRYADWWRWLAATYADLEVLTTAEFGRDFRSTYAENSWQYQIHARGTGVGLSDPATTVDWFFCKDYRVATLSEERRGRRRARLLDFVDYRRQQPEPDGPVNDISLRASPWQKRS